MNTLLEVKHKLKTQDIFRATTVRALVDECERLSAERAEFLKIATESKLIIEGIQKSLDCYTTTAALQKIAALRERVQALEALVSKWRDSAKEIELTTHDHGAQMREQTLCECADELAAALNTKGA